MATLINFYLNLLKKQKKSIFKKLSIINGLLLVFQVCFGSLFFITPINDTLAKSNLCSQPVDVVLIMDRSGSMDYTSRCDWWQLKCVNPPSCSSGYVWKQNTTYNQSQSWCTAKNQASPHQSSYLEINPKKIVAARQAANNFLGLMGTSDQSSLVSYANTATLDKALSNDHALTQTAINSLTPNGATNIGDAIKFGTQELSSIRANPVAVKAMILLTDGLANKPYGPGYGEWPADVNYAKSKADEAANSGFKIYTIGLGDNSEINESMLEYIANVTGAEYYHSPTQNDLQAIYDAIALRLCNLGSISGCKYSDIDKDGIITGHEKIAGWEIKLNHEENLTQLTDETGCYKFSGLLPGAYTISEGGKAGVASEQTYPASGSYTVNLAEGENLENYDFGNYLPVCGNSFIDTNYGEACEIGQTKSCMSGQGYLGEQTCLLDCSGWSSCIPIEYCGDNIINDAEECDTSEPRVCQTAEGYAGEQFCTSCAWGDCLPIEFCGDGIVNDAEECDTNLPRACLAPSGYAGEQTCTGCRWDSCVPTEYCGDGIVNDAEECDTNQATTCTTTDGYSGLKTCTNCLWDNCQTQEYCGDGVVNGSEECDDANTNNEDDCRNDCTIKKCKPDIDVMMVLDRSGSMGYSSRCDWWQLKCVNPPSCSGGYNWVQNTTYNQSQSWCLSKNQPSPHQSTWYDYTPVKIIAAKNAANGFLDLLETYDQSGLVSYANNATLDKTLSNNHAATKSAVNSLVTNGATNIGDAISLGKDELLSSRANPQAVKNIILLTDGMANKPYGPGYGEWPADVAYALAKAAEAASAGIKIFTIGLGYDVNAVMLGQIATNSGGKYYFSPSAADLQDIFDQIAIETCQK